MSRQPIVPAPPSVSTELLAVVAWVSDALHQLEAAGFSSQDLDVVYEYPNHPQEGMVRYFGEGGVDPGYGPGPYCYKAQQWGEGLRWLPMFTIGY